MDKLVVSRLFTLAEFGSYSLVGTLAQLPSIIVGPLLLAMLPRLTRMVAANETRAADALFMRFSRIVASLSACGAFGLILFAPEVLTLWLGRGEVLPSAINVVRILALGGFFLALNATPFYFGVSYGHNRTSVVIGIVALIVALPLLILGSLAFGLVGAAWPWVLVNGAQLAALYLIVVRRYYDGAIGPLIVSGTLVPLAIVAVPLCAARIISDTIHASALLAAGLAALGAGVGVAASGAGEAIQILRSRRTPLICAR